MIALHDVTKKFGHNTVLNQLNLTFDKEKMYAIMGESGCGKTTLLNLLGGLDKPSEGEVFYEEKPLKNIRKYLRYEIGYLFQNYALIEHKSVEDNLKIALTYKKTHTRKQDIEKVLKDVGLSGFEKKKIYELSGGEQQRVSLARLLLKPCKVILADEPTGNLDEKNRNDVITILQNIKKEGKCVIVATHDPAVAQACDEVITLEKQR